MFVRSGAAGDLQTAKTITLKSTAVAATDWKVGGYMNYSTHFSQANLVSASLQIQYVGQLQLEQGYFVGSQLYGVSPNTVTADDIENG